MSKPCVIYPVDGFTNAPTLIAHLEELFSSEHCPQIISHVKVNDAVMVPGVGPEIIRAIRDTIPADVGIFLDLKLADVSATDRNILEHYRSFQIDIITVRSQISESAIRVVRELFPDALVTVVCLLTDISQEECLRRYGLFPFEYIDGELCGLEAVWNCIGAVVCSPLEVRTLKERFPQFKFVVPGIRDAWMSQDHQERTTGVCAALEAGADLVVMGAQLSKGNPKKDVSPEQSQGWTLDEIQRYFNE